MTPAWVKVGEKVVERGQYGRCWTGRVFEIEKVYKTGKVKMVGQTGQWRAYSDGSCHLRGSTFSSTFAYHLTPELAVEVEQAKADDRARSLLYEMSETLARIARKNDPIPIRRAAMLLTEAFPEGIKP